MTAKKAGGGLVGIGVAACAGCCAMPILGFLAAVGIGAVVGVLVAGAIGLAVVMLALVPLVRRGRARPEPVTATAKRLLPLYDESAPIACTIGADEIADRIAVVERMRAAMQSIERTPTGVLLTFPRGSAIEDDVRRFVVDEKRCCPFWGFAVVDGDDALALRWDGPPSAAPLLDRIDTLLRTDEPVEQLAELL